MSERDRYTLPIQAGKKLILGQLTGAAECAAIVDRYSGPVLLITTDMQSALQLHDEILQFTRHPVLTLPDWETLTYDSFSPHQEIISDRIATLYRLPSLSRGVIILPVNSLMQRVCPYTFLHRHTLLMTKGQRLSRGTLRAQLEHAGYRSVDQVLEH
ncbi:transcription-repair coupling factor, partial [Sodalis-like symbiont of Bactericera trigonica]